MNLVLLHHFSQETGMNLVEKKPQLRFPEFSKGWKTTELNQIVEISSKKLNPKEITDTYKCIELEHLSQGTGHLLGYTSSNDQASTKNIFEKNQVLFGKLRPYLKKYWKATFDGVCSTEIWVLNGIKENNDYIFQLIQTHKFNQIANVSSGSKMPRSDWKYMAGIPFTIPKLEQEQQKIASFLMAVDTKIEQLSHKKTLLEQYKKGVMQKIFSQEIRFKADDGSDYPDWEEKKLGEVFSEIKDKVGKQNIETYSISAGKGFVSQKEKFGKDISGRQNENYTVLIPEQFSYNKGNSKIYKYGCIYHNTIGKSIAVPNVFISFTLIDNSMSVYFFAKLFEDHYLDRGLRKIISSSARMDGLLNVNKKYFFELLLPVPSSGEQQKIANFLSSVDTKIGYVSKQLDSTKEFKKALLQQMFV